MNVEEIEETNLGGSGDSYAERVEEIKHKLRLIWRLFIER